MIKVKALYHFLDKVACRNRMQGDVFDVSEERAKELEKAGIVALVEAKPKAELKTDAKNEPKSPSKKANKDPKK